MAHLIPCDFCAWEGPVESVGDHLDANPECAAALLESCREEEDD